MKDEEFTQIDNASEKGDWLRAGFDSKLRKVVTSRCLSPFSRIGNSVGPFAHGDKLAKDDYPARDGRGFMPLLVLRTANPRPELSVSGERT